MMPSGWTRKRGSTWTWYIEDVPDPKTGRLRQVSEGGFRTRRKPGDALLEAQAALRSGMFVEPSKRTLRTYLLEEWLPDNQPPRLRPSSFANYTNYTRIHVVPRLGDIELQRLTPSNLSAFYRRPSPTSGGTAKAWPPRRSGTSTRCCTEPSRTPSDSATWSATWPMPDLMTRAFTPPSAVSGLSVSRSGEWATRRRSAAAAAAGSCRSRGSRARPA
jgi:integrase-like protein